MTINIVDGDTTAAHVLTSNLVDASIANVTVSGTSTNGQADGITFTNVDSGTFTLSGLTNMDFTANYDAAFLAGAGDAVTLFNVNNANWVTSAANNDVAFAAGIETLTINATGAASKLVT